MKALFVLFLTLNFHFSLNAQFTPVLEKFTVLQKDGEVYLEWVMGAGSICLGIEIERAIDTSAFVKIGSIGGVCGNLTKSAIYNFTDEFPIENVLTKYRLTYGLLGHSEIKEIIVAEVGKNEYRCYPNPSKDLMSINFYNPKQETRDLKIINVNGKEVMSLVIQSDAIELDLKDFEPGLYHFLISDDRTEFRLSGRFIVSN